MNLLTNLSSAQLCALGIIADIGKAQAEDTAKIMEAFADTLPAFLEAATEDDAFGRKVFVLFEAVTKIGAAKRYSVIRCVQQASTKKSRNCGGLKKSKPKVMARPDPEPKG
ncbi:hypothetical protein D1823_07670 [Ruegeria sp. AD91A]|uniref:hypothetical protein n=1 Tax=Ruegeria sp. AD91A TaxID=2293862 RepID=UPI000E4CDC8A|nr:hypothetical protein [Ruegeria sp. AD91A]AXT26466.1 hypothetical protein D1823_07670 [Ruegeria sp. AD91A]